MKLPNNLKYFDVSRYWKILNPIYESNLIKEIALYEMNCHRENISKIHNFAFKETESFEYPKRFDSCDWRFSRKGRPPLFDNWICHAACHWIANINAAVVMEAFPVRAWRVINSDYHSTVWDGKSTIYDTNFYGLKIPIEDVIKGINQDPNLYIHEVGYIPFNRLEKDLIPLSVLCE